MPIFTQGGSAVTSASIVDNEIIDADISTAAAINLAKLAGTTNAAGQLIRFVVEEDSSLSITLAADETILLIATGNVDGGVQATLTLREDTVTIHEIIGQSASASEWAGTLLAARTPGAGTFVYDVVSSDTLLAGRIMALIIKITV